MSQLMFMRRVGVGFQVVRGKESTCQCRRCEFDPWIEKKEKEMATHSNILAWETHGQRSVMGYIPWG